MDRASEASVSMMRLIQSIWTAVRGLSVRNTDPTKARMMAVTFTVSWNCRNLRMQSKMLRPYLTADTIDLKLSSKRMMPAASLAI